MEATSSTSVVSDGNGKEFIQEEEKSTDPPESQQGHETKSKTSPPQNRFLTEGEKGCELFGTFGPSEEESGRISLVVHFTPHPDSLKHVQGPKQQQRQQSPSQSDQKLVEQTGTIDNNPEDKSADKDGPEQTTTTLDPKEKSIESSRSILLSNDEGHLLVWSESHIFRVWEREIQASIAAIISDRRVEFEQAKAKFIADEIAKREKVKNKLAKRKNINNNAPAGKRKPQGKKKDAREPVYLHTFDPTPPKFRISTSEFWCDELKNEKRRFITNASDFVQLAEEFMLRRPERVEYTIRQALPKLLDLIVSLAAQVESGQDKRRALAYVCFEVCKLLQNPQVLDLMPSLCASIAQEVLCIKSDVLDGAYVGLILWSVLWHEDAGAFFLKLVCKKESILEKLADRLERIPSVLSSCPGPDCITLLGSTCCLVATEQSVNRLETVEVQSFLVNIVRRGNDGDTIATVLAVLSNTFSNFIKDEMVDRFAKQTLFGLLSDSFASPFLVVHDVNKSRELSRGDLGTMLLAAGTLANACNNMDEHEASQVLLESGAIRRVFSLAEWSYQSVILNASNSKEADGFVGDVVIPNSLLLLEHYFSKLAPKWREDKNTLRTQVCKVFLTQALFMLSLSIHGMKAFYAAKPDVGREQKHKQPPSRRTAPLNQTTLARMQFETNNNNSSSHPQVEEGNTAGRPEQSEEEERDDAQVRPDESKQNREDEERNEVDEQGLKQEQDGEQQDTHDEQSFEEERFKSRQQFLEEITTFLFKCIDLIRDNWLRIAKEKEVQRRVAWKKAEQERERLALMQLEASANEDKNSSNNNNNEKSKNSTSTSQTDNENLHQKDYSTPIELSDIQVPEHQDEWWLRTCELCALRGIRALLQGGFLQESWVSENLDGSIANISHLTDAMTDESRRCNIDIFTFLFQAAEKWGNNFLLNKLAHMLEAAFVTDVMVSFPEEPNAAFLLSSVLRHSGKHCEEEVITNILSVINERVVHLETTEEKSCFVLMYLLDTLVQAAKFPKAREIMARLDGGSAMDAVLGALAKLLSFQDKQSFVYETILHCLRALTIILKNTRNAEKLVRVQGIQFLCTIIDEFTHSSLALGGRNPTKKKHYEVLIAALKLFRTVAVTRSTFFQKAILSPQVMDALFSVACGEFDSDPNEAYRDANAKAKRVAASVLVALPFRPQVGEPCLIAVARRFICLDYAKIPLVGSKQQAFGAKMLSRIELSDYGHELLRRTEVVQKLIHFASDRSDDIRQANALVGLLYLSSDNKKTQEHICATSLYRLLKLAWTADKDFEQALIAKLLEQLAKNKVNRTRIYKAEIRARAIVTRWANDKLCNTQDGSGSESQQRSKDGVEEVEAFNNVEEERAAQMLESMMRLRKDYSKWLRKDLKVKAPKTSTPFAKRAPGGADIVGKRKAVSNKKQLPTIESGAKRHSLCMSPKESPLWMFRDSILSPANNLSAVALSNSKATGFEEAKFLHATMYQPAKMLWTKSPRSSGSRDAEELLPVGVAIGEASKGTEEKSKVPLWKQRPAADPFLQVIEKVPRTDYTDDLDLPEEVGPGSLSLLELERASCDFDLLPAVSHVLGDVGVQLFHVLGGRLCPSLELSALTEPTLQSFKEVDDWKAWDEYGIPTDPPIHLVIDQVQEEEEVPKRNDATRSTRVSKQQHFREAFLNGCFKRVRACLGESTASWKPRLLEEKSVNLGLIALFTELVLESLATNTELHIVTERLLEKLKLKGLATRVHTISLTRSCLSTGKFHPLEADRYDDLFDWFLRICLADGGEKSESETLLSYVSVSSKANGPGLDAMEQVENVLQDNHIFIRQLEQSWGSYPSDWVPKIAPAALDLMVPNQCVSFSGCLADMWLECTPDPFVALEDFLVRVALMIPLPNADICEQVAGDPNDPLTFFSIRKVCEERPNILGLDSKTQRLLVMEHEVVPFLEDEKSCHVIAPLSSRLKLLLNHMRRQLGLVLPGPDHNGNKKILQSALAFSEKFPAISPREAVRHVVKVLEAKSCLDPSQSSSSHSSLLVPFLQDIYGLGHAEATYLVQISPF